MTTQAPVCIQNSAKCKFLAPILFGGQVRIAAVQHYGLAVRAGINIPFKS